MVVNKDFIHFSINALFLLLLVSVSDGCFAYAKDLKKFRSHCQIIHHLDPLLL